MAQASRNTRKLRRIKRERTLAYAMADTALKQRDVYRALAEQLIKASKPEAKLDPAVVQDAIDQGQDSPNDERGQE